jgi:hypothetical protein
VVGGGSFFSVLAYLDIADCGGTTRQGLPLRPLPPILTFNLTGGLRSSSWSFLILLLLSGRLNLLESVLFDIEEVELFELLELDELEFPFTVLVASLSNLTSHFFAAVWQTTPPPVMIPIF